MILSRVRAATSSDGGEDSKVFRSVRGFDDNFNGNMGGDKCVFAAVRIMQTLASNALKNKD